MRPSLNYVYVMLPCLKLVAQASEPFQPDRVQLMQPTAHEFLLSTPCANKKRFWPHKKYLQIPVRLPSNHQQSWGICYATHVECRLKKDLVGGNTAPEDHNH